MVTIDVPDVLIQEIQTQAFLLRNTGKASNHQFRLEATDRISYNVGQALIAILEKKLRQQSLIK